MYNIKEIYDQIIQRRSEYLALQEIHNDSKMSIMNAIAWTTSTVIFSFQSIMNAFMVDMAQIFNGRINGTPAYYANALLKWQYGNKLEVNADGTAFYYPTVDTSKNIITHVSYDEKYNSHYQDNILILKVAKDYDGHLERLSNDELIAAQEYINEIKFAGVKCSVISRKGDVLIPRVTVYYDGNIDVKTLRGQINDALINYMNDIPFDAAIYTQKVIDALQSVEHVTDVFVGNGEDQGIFVAQYNDDDELSLVQKIGRKAFLSSGYLKQSSRNEQEANLPTFDESIIIKLEGSEEK